MTSPFLRQKNEWLLRCLILLAASTLLLHLTTPPSHTRPTTRSGIGSIAPPAVPFVPAIVRGMTLYPDDPFRFDFIIDRGDNRLQGENLRKESTRLIKYFLASLTVPDKEMWVNLSPYEQNRVMADGLGGTEMGRDLLDQDYVLKQRTASLISPETQLGRAFWDKVYAGIREAYGTMEIPVNTFNKVWIIPDQATVVANGPNVFVVESRLRVMLEQDYLALERNRPHLAPRGNDASGHAAGRVGDISSRIIREVLLPEIEKEVNSGKHFSVLRQIYNSMILAAWYKQNLKSGPLNAAYVDQNKSAGIGVGDDKTPERIYQRYVETFEKGVFHIIGEEYDEVSRQRSWPVSWKNFTKR